MIILLYVNIEIGNDTIPNILIEIGLVFSGIRFGNGANVNLYYPLLVNHKYNF